MDIKSALEREHSKKLTLAIVDYVGDSPERMKELMACFFSKDLRVCQRASWPLSTIAENNFSLLKPYHKKFITELEHPIHNAIVRNILRSFALTEVPEDIEGELYEKCWNYVADVNKPTAARAFSLKILKKVAAKYPELEEELIPLLEEFGPHGTIGFKNAANKLLIQLKK